jgi:hypothetical protein
MPTMSEMEVMEVLSQLADSIHSKIRQISAFCKHQISQSRSHINDLLNSSVCKASTTCQVEDSEMFVRLVGGQSKEGRVGYQFAVGQS